MLTIVTSENQVHRRREGRGCGNQPELRQHLILEHLRTQIPGVEVMIRDNPISTEWLIQLHDREYLQFLEQSYPDLMLHPDPDWMDSTQALVPSYFCKTKPNPRTPIYKWAGFYGSDTISPIFEDTYRNSMVSAEQAFHAASIATDTVTAYALVNSPGHHAKGSEYGGYCFINNAVVAAYRLLELGHPKVAILDLDFHASNGCLEMVNFNPLLQERAMACSIHCSPEVDFPSFEGYTDDYPNPNLVNLPLMPHATWAEYKPALITGCERILQFGATAVVIAFGADTYIEDPDASPLGRFKLTLPDYDQMGSVVQSYFSALPKVVTQEGGYDLENVPAIVGRFLSQLIQ